MKTSREYILSSNYKPITYRSFTNLSVRGFLGSLFMMSLSAFSYAREIAGTCKNFEISKLIKTTNKWIYACRNPLVNQNYSSKENHKEINNTKYLLKRIKRRRVKIISETKRNIYI